MRVEMNTLELDERSARDSKYGAEAALRAVRAEMQSMRSRRLRSGEGECPETEELAAVVLRALQRTVGSFEHELSVASDRFHRAPTERGLKPVVLADNTNSEAP